MRKPFIVALHTERPLTIIQSIRRGRLLEQSKPYKQYLKRLRRIAKRRSDQWQLHPKKGGLLFRPSPMADFEVTRWVEILEEIDAGMGKPHEQLMLELVVWTREHR